MGAVGGSGGGGQCVGEPVWALSNDDLVAALDEVHGLEQRLAAVRLGLVREVDGRDLGVERGASCTAVWLRERLRVGVPAARRMLGLAKALDGGLPALREALAGGSVTVEQAQVIAVAVGSVPEDAGAGAADKATSTTDDSDTSAGGSMCRRRRTNLIVHDGRCCGRLLPVWLLPANGFAEPGEITP